MYVIGEFSKKVAILGLTKPVIDFIFYLVMIDSNRLLQASGYIGSNLHLEKLFPQRQFSDWFFLLVFLAIRYTIYWTIGEVRIFQWIFCCLKSPKIPLLGNLLSLTEHYIFKVH